MRGLNYKLRVLPLVPGPMNLDSLMLATARLGATVMPQDPFMVGAFGRRPLPRYRTMSERAFGACNICRGPVQGSYS